MISTSKALQLCGVRNVKAQKVKCECQPNIFSSDFGSRYIRRVGIKAVGKISRRAINKQIGVIKDIESLVVLSQLAALAQAKGFESQILLTVFAQKYPSLHILEE